MNYVCDVKVKLVERFTEIYGRFGGSNVNERCDVY